MINEEEGCLKVNQVTQVGVEEVFVEVVVWLKKRRRFASRDEGYILIGNRASGS
jgi:hypothetical protein